VAACAYTDRTSGANWEQVYLRGVRYCGILWGIDCIMNITTKMTVYTTCILALVLGLLLTMNYFKYGNILTDVTTSRLAVINKNLEFSLSRATNLGLALEELQFADTLLKRAKGSDPAIREIEVFDLSGKVLFSTADSVANKKVDASVVGLIAPLRGRDTTEWAAHSKEQFVTGVTLYNSFDRAIGGVVLHYDRSGYVTLVEGVLEKLLVVTAVVLGIAALVACIGISLGFRELRHTYASMQTALANLKESGDSAENGSADPEASDFRGKLSTVTATMNEAMNEIDVSVAAADTSKA
tara:strand:+ start:349 stop:1239 length:891 start_codon:yes stop_codon:yes gene_type:complete